MYLPMPRHTNTNTRTRTRTHTPTHTHTHAHTNVRYTQMHDLSQSICIFLTELTMTRTAQAQLKQKIIQSKYPALTLVTLQ